MDLHFQSAAVIARLIRDRRISAAEVLEHFLARIDSCNGRSMPLSFVLPGRPARARAADEAPRRVETLGPLHGVPMIALAVMAGADDIDSTVSASKLASRSFTATRKSRSEAAPQAGRSTFHAKMSTRSRRQPMRWRSAAPP